MTTSKALMVKTIDGDKISYAAATHEDIEDLALDEFESITRRSMDMDEARERAAVMQLAPEVTEYLLNEFEMALDELDDLDDRDRQSSISSNGRLFLGVGSPALQEDLKRLCGTDADTIFDAFFEE